MPDSCLKGENNIVLRKHVFVENLSGGGRVWIQIDEFG